MQLIQKIVRKRREYSSWVANETMEDYSLRYAPRSFRKWSPLLLANTALGGISFLALEAIGGSLCLSYGFTNSFRAIIVCSVVIFLTGVPITYYSARYNLDMDLLTRGAGFGYIGSTVTSVIYASFTFIFFALEAAIMAQALELYFRLPLVLGYLFCSLCVIPLVAVLRKDHGGAKQLAGAFLASLAVRHGASIENAAKPIVMYLTGYEYVFSSRAVVLFVAMMFVVISQMKINVTNAYAGSLAWSNIFSRLSHRPPGRVVWLIFNVAIALLLMVFGVFHTLDKVLALYSNVAIAWIGAIVADLVINKPLGLSPPYIELKRAPRAT